jgi:hypothetical protein
MPILRDKEPLRLTGADCGFPAISADKWFFYCSNRESI